MVYSKTNILLIYQLGFIQDLKLDGGGGGGATHEAWITSGV